ncbi:hypothetical protein Tco_1009634, partial [Tanacetum coccineum]
MHPMAFSSSSPNVEVSNDSICLKFCLEIVKLLKSQNDQLLKDLKKSELMILGYKIGLESVEEKLEVYTANESIYLQDIKGLKFEIHIGEITIKELRKKLEIVQKEKDGIQLNVDNFAHASKSLNNVGKYIVKDLILIQDQGPTSGIRANRGTLNLSDDEASNHEDASDTRVAPKQQQQVIQNGNSKKRISTGKDGVIRILPPVSPAEIQAVEKERKAKNILLMAIPKEHMRRFHGMDDAKVIWEAI